MFALRPLALGLLCLGALSACGGTQSTVPVALPTPVATPSPTPAPPGGTTTTLAVSSAPATATLPAVNGATTTVTFGAVSPPAGATIAVSASTTPPAGIVALQGRNRRPQALTRTTLAYFTWVPSATITLSAFPQLTATFPTSTVPAGTSLHEAFLDGSTAQPVYQLDVAFGPNGATLSSTVSAPTLQAGKTYVFVIYLETGAAPSPAPSTAPSTAPSSAPSTAPSTAPSASPSPVSGAFLGNPASITKVADGFPAGGAFYDGEMTLGSDNQLWLADQRTQAIRPLDPVAKTLGAGYPFMPPGFTSTIRPGNLVRGVDDRLWIVTFDDTSNIYAMKLDGTLQKIDSRVPSHVGYVNRLAAGSDGRMWGISGDSMRVFTPAGGLTVYPLPGARTGNDCPMLTLSSDGNMWYICHDAVGKVTPSGVVTEYPGHGGTLIGAGPDGSVWMKGSGLTMARVSPDGTYKEFPLPNYENTCTSIVRGPDDMMYVGCSNGLYRIVTTGASAGTITLLANYQTAGYTIGFSALTVGPDRHSLWSLNDVPYAQLIR